MIRLIFFSLAHILIALLYLLTFLPSSLAVTRFHKLVKLKAFTPFSDAVRIIYIYIYMCVCFLSFSIFSILINFLGHIILQENALSNINDISEGIVNETLRHFLEANLPKDRKKVTVAVAHQALAQTLADALKVTPRCDQVLQIWIWMRIRD